MTDNAQAWTVYNSLMVDPLTHTVYSAGEEVHLPEMEYQLLYYFLQHPGQTLSRKTLMLAVWGAPAGLKTRTLDIHICQLRKKLKLGSSLQTVFKVGYSERCEQVSSVKDLYGTTHSVSYKFDPWQEAWAKFKLDGKYDTFEANIVTSDDTNRDANMSIEIYVDDVLVGRVDDIVRDENVRPISVSVNGGKVLMIKAVNTNSAGNSYCYVSDTNLALLQ